MNPEKIINQESVAEAELKRKVELIEELPIDTYAKSDLILALLEIKPASVIDFHRGRVGRRGNLEEALKECGLYFEKEVNYVRYHAHLTDHLADYFVSKNLKNVQELHQGWNDNGDLICGVLLGFPQTAVEAYAKKEWNKLLTIEEVEFLEKKFRVNIPFRMTRDNWQEEIKVAQKWADALKKYAPRVYDELMEDVSKI